MKIIILTEDDWARILKFLQKNAYKFSLSITRLRDLGNVPMPRSELFPPDKFNSSAQDYFNAIMTKNGCDCKLRAVDRGAGGSADRHIRMVKIIRAK